MHLLKYIAAIIAAAPMMASAASQFNAEQVTCSGTQTTDTTNGLQIDCVGSLTIFGGSLASDEDIKLTASDALYLDAITLTTPKNISLTGSSVSVAASVKLDANQVFVNSATNVVDNGGINPIQVQPPVISPVCLGGNGVNAGVVTVHQLGGGLGAANDTSGGSVAGGQSSAGTGGAIQLRNGDGSPAAGTISVGGSVDSTIGGGGAAVILTPGSGQEINPWFASTCELTGTPLVFKLIEEGTRYCVSGKTRFHQVRFIRTTAECRSLPTMFEMAATRDFPAADTTLRLAQCTNEAGLFSSCLVYDAIDGSGNPIQPSAGRLELKWNKNGTLQKLEGRIIEITADDCYSESTLKLVKGKK